MASATSFNPGSPRTLAGIDLPARARRVLARLERAATSPLARQLEVVLREAEAELTRLAEASRGHQSEALLVEALDNLRRHGPALVPRFTGELEAELAQIHAPRVSRRLEELALPSQGLSLLDDSEMDEGAVLGGIATRSDARNSLALQLLGHRFGVLAGAPGFDAEHLPLGPHALCHALRNASEAIGLPLATRLQIYRQFDKVAMAHYPALLDVLNARLTEDGILPHLSFVPVRTRSPAPGVAHAAAAPTPARGPESLKPAIGAETASPALHGPSYADLRELLAHRRKLLAKLRPAGGEERVRDILAREDVLGALRRMRLSAGKTGMPGEIRQTLLAQARQRHGRGVALEAADSDGFELLGLWLGQLQRELLPGSPGEAMIERLKLPLLQLGLRDPGLFADPAHPARELLNAVSLAGARWLGEDDLEPQWLGLLQRALGSVLEDPDAGLETFIAANHVLQDGLQAAARKQDMGERRHVEAARGREKLELARLQAGDEIARLVAGRVLPRFHDVLLEQAWSDVLALVLLRGGDASAAWSEARQATSAIIEASLAPTGRLADPAFLGKLQDALAQVGYHAEDAAAIAHQLANGRAEDAALASRTELVVQLKARARLGDDTLAAAGTMQPPRSPAEDAAYARLGAIARVCWIDLFDPAQERIVRRRLAWVGPRTGHVLLLNRRRQRLDGYRLDGLARAMVAGGLQRVEADTHPAELAWQATLAGLHRIAEAQPGQPETPHGE